MATNRDRFALGGQTQVTAKSATGPIAFPCGDGKDEIATAPDQGATTPITSCKGT